MMFWMLFGQILTDLRHFVTGPNEMMELLLQDFHLFYPSIHISTCSKPLNFEGFRALL